MVREPVRLEDLRGSRIARHSRDGTPACIFEVRLYSGATAIPSGPLEKHALRRHFFSGRGTISRAQAGNKKRLPGVVIVRERGTDLSDRPR